MELREEELIEEQLQLMTEYHSKKQINVFAPSWIKSAADTHRFPRTHGGSMCATIVATRSSRGGLMSANGGTRSNNIEKKNEVQFYDLWYFSSKKIWGIGFCDIELWFPLVKEPGIKKEFWIVHQESLRELLVYPSGPSLSNS
jgi:hypothetical protein